MQRSNLFPLLSSKNNILPALLHRLQSGGLGEYHLLSISKGWFFLKQKKLDVFRWETSEEGNLPQPSYMAPPPLLFLSLENVCFSHVILQCLGWVHITLVSATQYSQRLLEEIHPFLIKKGRRSWCTGLLMTCRKFSLPLSSLSCSPCTLQLWQGRQICLKIFMLIYYFVKLLKSSDHKKKKKSK